MSKPSGAGCFLTESIMRFAIGSKTKPKVNRCSPTQLKGEIHSCFVTISINFWILQRWSGKSQIFAVVKLKTETEAEQTLSCWLGLRAVFFNGKCGLWLLIHLINSFHPQWGALGDKGLLQGGAMGDNYPMLCSENRCPLPLLQNKSINFQCEPLQG